MATGFCLSRPSETTTSEASISGTNWIYCGKFAAPAGTLNITELGGFMRATTSGRKVRLAIFTDDGTYPETMVSGSETAELAIANSGTHVATYGSVNVTGLTGGVNYWICAFFQSTAYISRNDTGGTNGVNISATYPTWLTGSAWHTEWTPGSREVGVWAVYSNATSDLNIPGVADDMDAI